MASPPALSELLGVLEEAGPERAALFLKDAPKPKRRTSSIFGGGFLSSPSLGIFYDENAIVKDLSPVDTTRPI